MESVYEGSCHCRRVRFRITADLSPVIACNCSICTKKGILHVIIPPDRFTLLAGDDALSTYQFGTHTARHQFCRYCGMHPFYVPRSDPDKIDVNVRCLDDVDVEGLAVVPFDGRHWEQAMAAGAPWRKTAEGQPQLAPAGPADGDVLLPLMRAFYAHERLRFDEQESPRALRTLLSSPARGRVFLVRVGEEVVGYAVLALGYSLEFLGVDAFVDELFLVAAFRGRGIGRAVMEELAAVARSLGVRALHLEVERANDRARAAYGRWGFVEHDRFLMTRRLG